MIFPGFNPIVACTISTYAWLMKKPENISHHARDPLEPGTLAIQRLRASAERVTPARVTILELLLGAANALSHQEIVELLATGKHNIDRVTVYRVLDWLVARQLAHKVAGDDRVWRFNAVNDEKHIHPHFHCNHCGKLSCLSNVQINIGFLPAGYTLTGAETIIQGFCPSCSAQ